MLSALSIIHVESLRRKVLVAFLGAISFWVWFLPGPAEAAGVGRCGELSAFIIGDERAGAFEPREQRLTSAVPLSQEAERSGGCELAAGEPLDADPASNLCFEDAGEPISTLPRLLAEWRGVREAAAVVGSILDVMDQDNEHPAAAESVDAAARAAISLEALRSPGPSPRPLGDALSCTVSLDECDALPPLIRLGDGATAAAVEPARDDESSHFGEQNSPQILPWAALKIGPRSGYIQELEKPPRRA